MQHKTTLQRLLAKLKGSLKSKTVWFSGLLMVFGAISDNSQYLASLLDAHTYNIVMMLVGIIIAALRYTTTQDLADK